MPSLEADDGVRLHYDEDDGQGRPLVFVHGWMMSGRFFRRQREAFRGSHRVVVPDLRGCGGSATRSGSVTLNRLAADLRELVTYLGLHDLVLVGWSLGGGITMRYLDTYGTDGVRGVCLVDFPPRLREAPDVADKVCRSLATRRDEFFQGFLRRMFLTPPDAPDAAWMVEENRKCASDTACETYRQMRDTALPEQRGPYDLPALLAFPEHGWFRPALEEWQTLFPRHLAPAFPRSAHCPFWEEPERFNEALREFADS